MKRYLFLLAIAAVVCPIVLAQEGPTADFSATPTSGEPPLTVQFTDLSDPGSEPITLWEWDFDDDATIDSYDQNPGCIYDGAGTYSVSLTVTTAVDTDTVTYTDLIYVGVYSHIYVDAVSGDNTTADGSGTNPYKTITYAFARENADGTPDPWHVHVLPGTYDADPAKDPIDKEVYPINLRDGMVLSGTSAEECIIDAVHVTESIVPILEGIDDQHITIKHLTLRNMNRQTGDGGAVYLENPSGTMQGCIIADNSASYGAGLYIYNAMPGFPFRFIDNTFTDNSTIGSYGEGGGFYVSGSHAGEITGNTFSGNSAGGNGGGFHVYGSHGGEITGNTFTGNSGGWGGGGCYVSGSHAGEITGNTFSGNSAGGKGGGFYVYGNHAGEITGNTFSSNSSGNSMSHGAGGGFYSSSIEGDVTGNTFCANSVTCGDGAGFCCGSVAGNISENRFCDNTIIVGPGGFGCSGGGSGGGFCVNGLEGDASGNMFTGNSANGGNGGGFSVNGLEGGASGNIFSDNSAVSGGGLYLAGTPRPRIVNNFFLENRATDAGNEAYTESDCDIENNLFLTTFETNAAVRLTSAAEATEFHNNIFSGMGTAIRMDGSFDLEITHNVFHAIVTDILNRGGSSMGTDLGFIELLLGNCRDNLDTDPDLVGAGVATGTWTANGDYDPDDGETVLTDSNASWDEDEFAGALVDIVGDGTYAIILGNTTTQLRVRGDVTLLTGLGESYTIDDYHLNPDSPCVNAGALGKGGDTDFEGEPRPTGTLPDIGPDEYRPPPPVAPVITTDGGNGPGVDYGTTQSALTLEGTCGTDADEIRVNGSTSGVAHMSGGTLWSYSGTLVEGDNSFSVAAVNTVGVPSDPAAIVVTLDTTPPGPPPITTNGGENLLTNQSVLTLEGTCDSDTAEIRVNGSTGGVTYTPGTTTWSYSGALVEGGNTFSVVAADALGNTSDPSTIYVTLDTQRPQVLSGLALNSTTVRVVFSEQMKDNTDLVNPAFYMFTGGGVDLVATAVSRENVFTVHVTVNEMTGGANYMVHVAISSPTDLAGNRVDPTANSAEFVAYLGPLDPPVITTNNGDDFLTNQPALTLQGTCVADTVEIWVNGSTDGVTHTIWQTTWSYSGTLDDGPNSFAVAAVDIGGTPSQPDTITVVLDTTRPKVISGSALDSTTVRVLFDEEMAANADLVDPTFYIFTGSGVQLTAGSVERINATTVDVTVNEMTDGAGYTAYVSTTSPTDLAGNHVDPLANSAGFTGSGVPPGAPVITTNDGNDFSTTDSELTLDGTCDADTAELRVNGSTTGVSYTPGSTSWSCAVTLQEGPNTFSVVASDEAENVSSAATISVFRLIATTITCAAEPTAIRLGRAVTVHGTMSATDGSGTIVSFTSTSPSGVVDSSFPEAISISGTGYSRTFYPTEASEGKAPWEVMASWPGDDTHRAATSAAATFSVTKTTPTLSLELSASSIPVGLGGIDDLTARASLMAPIPDELAFLLEGRTIELKMKDPDGATPVPLTATTVLETTLGGTTVGVATFDLLNSGIDFNKAGTWKFLANFNENDNLKRASTPNYDDDDAVRLIVKDGAGYAIIVLGKLDWHAEGHREHAKTTDFVYGVLRDRGLAHEDIHYLRDVLGGETVGPDIVVDGAATQDNVQHAIEQWALARMGERAAPLYVIFVDHGRRDRFYLYSTQDDDDYVAPDDVADYFETLRTGLEQASEDAADQEIVFIYGACRSGSFIPSLSGEQRVVITSCAEDEISHRGVIDPADGVRDGEVFVTELFRNASTGKTLEHSFELAAEKVAEYTATRSNSRQSDRPQHPLLDDPGDRAEYLVLGFGSNAGRSVGWQHAMPMVVGPDEPIGVLEARADRDYLTEDYEAWVEVKTPSYDGGELADDDYDDLQKVVTMPRVSYSPGISDLDTGTFRWASSDLTGAVDFSEPGTYKIFYYITDPETEETSSYLLTTIYRGQEENQAPLPVTLLYPEDGATVGRAPVFIWEATTDPDGDAFTYRLEVAEDSGFTTGLIVKEGLTWTAAVISMTDELKDLQTYYWRVIPVDEYGAAPEDNTIRTFTTDFQNEELPGAIVGLVTDAHSGTPIAGAEITVTPSPGTETASSQGNYVVANLPSGSHTVEVSATGYESDAEEAEVPAGGVVEANFQLVPLETDSDGDGIPDAEEGTNDPDDDGIPNYLDTDSDGDGILDCDEGTGDPDQDGVPNYLDTDSDDDGLSDADEVSVYGTSPTSQDTDEDSMPDCYEVQYGLDPTTDDAGDDADSDGLNNAAECEQGCDPTDVDSDNDSLSDADEVNIYGTDPTLRDTDGDGASDGREVDAGTDPLDEDDKPPFEFGDVDADGEVNAIDVQLVINEALGITTGFDCDVNGDGLVNALDVQLVINAALGIV